MITCFMVNLMFSILTGLLRKPYAGALSTIHAAANPKYDGQTALYFENAKPTNLRSLPRYSLKMVYDTFSKHCGSL